MNTWIFYSTDDNGIKTIQYIKDCAKPQLTKEYKETQELLWKVEVSSVGHMTSQAWNKENQYIKIR